MGALLNKDLVETAIEMLEVPVNWYLNCGVPRDNAIAVVVSEVDIPIALSDFEPGDDKLSNIQLFEKHGCLFVGGFGEEKKWRESIHVALSKAHLCSRTGKSLTELAPHYRMVGDTVYDEGGIVLDGIVVACSGIEGYLDEMIATMAAAAIRAEAKRRFDIFRKENPDQPFLL